MRFSLIHLQPVIKLEASRRCTPAICMLKDKSQKQNVGDHKHTVSAAASDGSLPGYLFDPARRKNESGGSQGFRWRLYGLRWGRWTEHGVNSGGHMDAIHCTFQKQSISLNGFGLTGPGHTHTHSLLYSSTVWNEWCVCVFLGPGFATGHLD